MSMATNITDPLTLKCGLQLPNRLVKAAMAEGMANDNFLPDEYFGKSYSQWAKGEWGMILTGNVQVNTTYLGGSRDVAVDPANEVETIKAWRAYASACKTRNTPTVMQINHPGKQSPLGAGKKSFCTKNLAPSAIPLQMGDSFIAKKLISVMFGTPKEMTETDIQEVVKQFAYTARLAAKTGFDGVEIHAAHGYLLAQFLSAKSNQRMDAYGGSPAKRTKIVLDIITAIREEVPPSFCVGIKLNSVDYQSVGELKDCIEQLKLIVETGVDFVEISGGTYEDPQMSRGIQQPALEKSDRTQAREAYFLDFAKSIRNSFPSVPLIVTGGFRTRQGMSSALRGHDCDMVGVGRPAVLNPTLPKDIIFNTQVSDEDANLEAKRIDSPWLAKLTGIKAVGSGAETKWYSEGIRNMGQQA